MAERKPSPLGVELAAPAAAQAWLTAPACRWRRRPTVDRRRRNRRNRIGPQRRGFAVRLRRIDLARAVGLGPRRTAWRRRPAWLPWKLPWQFRLPASLPASLPVSLFGVSSFAASLFAGSSLAASGLGGSSCLAALAQLLLGSRFAAVGTGAIAACCGSASGLAASCGGAGRIGRPKRSSCSGGCGLRILRPAGRLGCRRRVSVAPLEIRKALSSEAISLEVV